MLLNYRFDAGFEFFLGKIFKILQKNVCDEIHT
jgi:hypothetical protein